MNILRNKRSPQQHNLSIFAKNKIPSILVARQRTSHVLNLLSIAILQNIANTLFASTGVRKGMLLYCFRFELILNSENVVSANAQS